MRLMKLTHEISELLLEVDEERIDRCIREAKRHCAAKETMSLKPFLEPDSWGGYITEFLGLLVRDAPTPIDQRSAEVGSAAGACGEINLWFARDPVKALNYASQRINALLPAALKVRTVVQRWVSASEADSST